MNTTTAENTSKNTRKNEVVGALVEVGTAWARHGIGIGIGAVRTQAELFRALSTTLDRAAETLATVTKPITEKGEATAKDAPASDVVDTTATVQP